LDKKISLPERPSLCQILKSLDKRYAFTTFPTTRLRYKSELRVISHVALKLIRFFRQLKASRAEGNPIWESSSNPVYYRAKSFLSGQGLKAGKSVKV